MADLVSAGPSRSRGSPDLGGGGRPGCRQKPGQLRQRRRRVQGISDAGQGYSNIESPVLSGGLCGQSPKACGTIDHGTCAVRACDMLQGGPIETMQGFSAHGSILKHTRRYTFSFMCRPPYLRVIQHISPLPLCAPQTVRPDRLIRALSLEPRPRPLQPPFQLTHRKESNFPPLAFHPHTATPKPQCQCTPPRLLRTAPPKNHSSIHKRGTPLPSINS